MQDGMKNRDIAAVARGGKLLTRPLQVIKRMAAAWLGWRELRLMAVSLLMSAWVLDMMIRLLQMFPHSRGRTPPLRRLMIYKCSPRVLDF